MSRISAVSPTTFLTFGDLLKHLRKQAGLTQRELSIAVGYSDAHLSRMEQNQRVPDAATITARFVPALHLEREPQWVARLLELAQDTHYVEEPVPMPDAPAPTTTRHNLPLQLTRFIGREREVADVQRLLSTTRLVTLTGSGGTGKTRLALQIGAESLADFSHGAWLVELAPIAEPSQVPTAVAQALPLRAETVESEASGRDALSLIIEHLSSKRLLLILDNCEHLVEACAQLADHLLRAAPGLHILATSREALGVRGERIYPVPGLSVPDVSGHLSLEAVAESEAVRLFVERAVAGRPDFSLTDENASAITRICRRLDGIPLAIELAAARAHMLSVEQIAALLDNALGNAQGRFQLLTGGNRTAPPRQQTLRGAIDWSYELLTNEERALLRRLSVFVGGWALEAATPVMGGLGVLDWLTQLVAKSLVVSTQPPGQATRFRMLETIREYAHEKLVQAGEEATAQNQHLAFYVSLAEQAEPELRGHGQAKWLKRLDQEHDNLRAALAWAVKTEDAEAAMRLAGALAYYWVIRGNESEGRRWLEAALDLPTSRNSLEPSAWRAKALLGAGWLGRLAGNKDLNVSLSRLEKGLAIYQELEDKAGIAYGLYLLGSHRRAAEKDYARALGLYQEALDLWMEAEDGWGVGICLHWMGHTAEGIGDRAKAGEFYQRSVEILRQEGDLFQLTGPRLDLVRQALAEGDIARARALLEENLAIQKELGHEDDIVNTLSYLASISLAQGDYAQAQEVLHLMQNTRSIDKNPAVLTRLGEAEYLQGHLAKAGKFFEAGFEGWAKENDPHGQAWALARLGCVAYRLENLDQAARLLEQSLTNLGPRGWWWNRALTLLTLADVARVRGEPEKAAELYARSLRIIMEENAPPDMSERFEGFAKLAVLAQQPQRAARLFGAAQALRDRIGTPIPPVERADYDGAVAQTRAQLDPAEFDAAWAEGQAMGWEQAAAYALNEIEI